MKNFERWLTIIVGCALWFVAVVCLVSIAAGLAGCATAPQTEQQRVQQMIDNPALHFGPVALPIRNVALRGARP